MATAKAPKGGLVSHVNGQFYNGGEFVPDTGLFCGKKGAKRRDKVEDAKNRNRYYDLGGSRLFECFSVSGGSSIAIGVYLADNRSDVIGHAKETFTAGYFKAGSFDAREI